MDQCSSRTNRGALHFCDVDVKLSAKKPLSKPYPKTLQTVGDHLRKKRLALDLFQQDVARLLGVDTLTVCNWENNLTNRQPDQSSPQSIRFSWVQSVTSQRNQPREKVNQYRIQKGLSLRRLAKQLGIDPATLASWEKGESEPTGKLKERVSL